MTFKSKKQPSGSFSPISPLNRWTARDQEGKARRQWGGPSPYLTKRPLRLLRTPPHTHTQPHLTCTSILIEKEATSPLYTLRRADPRSVAGLEHKFEATSLLLSVSFRDSSSQAGSSAWRPKPSLHQSPAGGAQDMGALPSACSVPQAEASALHTFPHSSFKAPVEVCVTS